MTYSITDQIRWWLPIVSAFLLTIKAYTTGKKNVASFCDKLLSNHLAHIQDATASTVIETKETNKLLATHSAKMNMVQATLEDHQKKNLIVWQGVIESLTILKERTRNPRKVTTPRKAKRNV